jgi:hypothetical protein
MSFHRSFQARQSGNQYTDFEYGRGRGGGIRSTHLVELYKKKEFHLAPRARPWVHVESTRPIPNVGTASIAGSTRNATKWGRVSVDAATTNNYHRQQTHRDLDDPLIIPISVERVCVRRVLSAHGDTGPTELFDSDEGFLEVCVFGKDVCAEVEGKVFRDENVV